MVAEPLADPEAPVKAEASPDEEDGDVVDRGKRLADHAARLACPFVCV